MRHSRRIVLFVAAIAVPCLVLVALALRMVRQDHELAENRAAEDRLRQINQIRQDTLNKLEQTKLRAAAGQVPPEAVLVTPLPWRHSTAAALPRSEEIERGEQAEFSVMNPQLAVEHYARALDTAKDPAQAAYARLLLARTLYKVGRPSEAAAQWRALLSTPLELTDENRIPFALYAAERLKTLPPAAFDHLNALPLTALYLMKSITDDPRLTQRLEWAERVEALTNELPSLEARYALKEVWAPFGDPPWLVSIAQALKGGNQILVAVRADAVLPALAPGGVDLGPAFPGLKIEVPRVNAPASDARQSLLYIALILVVSLTLFGGYLLWRDLRREVALSEMRSQFVSSVSHELKTPLTAIRMFAETLRMRDSTPSVRGEYLDTIISESERLSRLVDNVLDFSKIERGRKNYRFESVSLAEVIESAAQTMKHPLEQQGFELLLDATDDATIRADKDALEQAVLNLLTNAMKYSGDSREIALRLRCENGSAIIQVEDHGVGIAQEEHKRIFERFYRAPTRENQLIPGAGLGLTLVEHIAQAHGGDVVVESEPGRGCIFSIRIPSEVPV